MKSFFKIIVVVTMVFGIANAANKPFKGKKMVVTLASGDLMASGLGTALAWGAAKSGAEVTVIIGANSLKYVTKGGWGPKFPAKKKSIKTILKRMVDTGAEILICGMCAKVNGLSQSDFIDGAIISMPPPILNAMLDPEAKTFEY
jgi:predicted peroxiredoxin